MRVFVQHFLCILCIFFMGCGKSPSKGVAAPFQPATLRVLSTTAMIGDIVGRIVGNRVQHDFLIRGETDPHSYELIKGDDEKISMAQLIFYNGLGLEHGASLRYHLENHPRAIAIGDVVREQASERLLKIDGQIDPHIWMDISLWSLIVDPIVNVLVHLDHEGESFYRANAERLKREMKEVHEAIITKMQNIPIHLRFLVTSHDAFQYFTRAYLASTEEQTDVLWKDRCAAPEGIAPDGQLSATDIQRIAQHVIEHQIAVIFPESNVSRDALKKIANVCQKKGWKLRFSQESLFGDAMGTDSYLTMIVHNAEVLMRAWQENCNASRS
jgi:manganese/zinc/iron transport system substrate-binding protein